MKSIYARVLSMRSLPCLILTALIAFGSTLSAQPLAQNETAPSSPAPAACDPDKFERGSPLDVHGDASNPDLQQYLSDLVSKIRMNWHRAIPPEARSSSTNKGCATVEFVIKKDGKLAGMKVVESSGNATLEQWAQTAITQSAPFDSLPQQFTGDSLELRYRFHFRPFLGHPMSPRQEGEGQFGAAGGMHPGSASAPRPGDPIEGKTYQGQPVYKAGGSIAPPKPIYQPDPEYPESARKKKLEGTVVLEVLVTPDGDVADVKVVRASDPDLGQNAVDAVRRWKFNPSTKDAKPVAVQINVETCFHFFK